LAEAVVLAHAGQQAKGRGSGTGHSKNNWGGGIYSY
jgi:hypothetical protein